MDTRSRIVLAAGWALVLSLGTCGCATCLLCGQPRNHNAIKAAPGTLPLVLPSLQGTVTYLQRVAMPPSADVVLTLWDLTGNGQAPQPVAEKLLQQPGQVPVEFSWTLEAAPLDPRHEYALRAKIVVDGAVLFATDTDYRVLTLGHPSTVQLVLSRPAPAPDAP